jgi:hypothetical protein
MIDVTPKSNADLKKLAIYFKNVFPKWKHDYKIHLDTNRRYVEYKFTGFFYIGLEKNSNQN